MNADDLIPFAELLHGTCTLLTRGRYSPDDTSTMVFFNALSDFPMQAVRQAFSHHVKVSTFAPTPAEMLGYLETSDGRLGVEEAWALARSVGDEFASVVWTQEIAEAWGVARHIMPDKVGARMAFKEAYERLVTEARIQRAPVAWLLCEGFDTEGRTRALQQAAAQGRHVAGCEDLLALPAPRAVTTLALPAPEGDEAPTPAALTARERLKVLREQMAKPKEPAHGPGFAARMETAEAQRRTLERVAKYGLAHGIPMKPPAEALASINTTTTTTTTKATA